ncbi:PASTA domain-containing protein [Adlercreutzia equolifaciens]|uniref:PASTA domain-containing protein n=1 Tax=Adlercreutzia equolifaciens TaxID=446660 RepID=UPI0023B1B23C|nr:PASTA domain-containing protein [Adlercreutzia equolifaciens]MDE8703206.1 PASTA domain-containing protein [Adlercreutzia equolifaciens]
MKCPHCSFENRPDAPFCENCGEVFPARMDIPEIITPSTDAKRRGEVLSDVPPIVKVPEIPRPEVKRVTPEEGSAPLPDPVDIPDLSGFERLVDSSYIPPAPRNSAGDTAELPRIEEEYVPRARSYTLGLDPKEQRKRDREQKRLEKKYVKQQQKEEARLAKEQEKAAKAAQKAAAAEERAARKAAEEEERQARKAAEAEERAARKAAEDEARAARKAAEEEARAAQEAAAAERRAADEAAALAAAEEAQSERAASLAFEEASEEAAIEPGAKALPAESATPAAEDTLSGAEEPTALMAAAGAAALAEPGITSQEAEEASLTLAPRRHTGEHQALAPADTSASSADESAGLAVAAPAASGALSLGKTQDAPTEDTVDEPAPAKSRSAASATQAPKVTRSTTQPSHGRTGRSKKPLVIGICAVVLVIALAVAGGTYYAELWGGRTVPDVIGMAQDAAIEDLEQRVFAVEATTVPSDEPEGTVISCDPAVGSRIEEGSTVVLTVATPRLVPKVKGLSQQEAADALAAEGFTAIEYKEKKSNKDEGTVLSVSPKAGEEAKADTPITLTVAVPFTVPDVEGKSQDEAIKLLEDEGYNVSTDWYVTEDIEEGTAVFTDPEAGTKLDSGSDVTLYIAHSRGTELRELTASILPGATLTIDKVTYQVQDVKSTSYRGDGEVNYTVTAKKYEVVTLPFGLGEKTYYDDKVQTIEGGIVWDDNNEVSYASPAIRY